MEAVYKEIPGGVEASLRRHAIAGLDRHGWLVPITSRRETPHRAVPDSFEIHGPSGGSYRKIHGEGQESEISVDEAATEGVLELALDKGEL